MENQTDPVGFGNLLAAYFEWMQIKNYSANTLINHRKNLRCFSRWCGERGITRPSDMTKAMIERYQRWLYHYRKEDGNPLMADTQKERLLVIKLFFRWLSRTNRIGFNPASDIELPINICRLPKGVLEAREVEAVLAQPDIHDPCGLRDRAILETLYSTGLRRMEIANLNTSDIDFSRGVLFVRQGKGRKDRWTPVGERAMGWIHKYLDESRPLLTDGSEEDALFISCRGKRLSLERISQIARYYVAAGAPGKPGAAHIFRHTMATLMLDNGADIRYVQEMLGHAQLSTTQVYTHVAIGKLKEVHKATHPAKEAAGCEEDDAGDNGSLPPVQKERPNV